MLQSSFELSILVKIPVGPTLGALPSAQDPASIVIKLDVLERDTSNPNFSKNDYIDATTVSTGMQAAPAEINLSDILLINRKSTVRLCSFVEITIMICMIK
jgi:hypothetical protein